MSKWYEKSGIDSDVVISSRVRLARNLKDYSFSDKLSSQEREEIISKVSSSILESNSYVSSQFFCLELNKLSDEDRVSLVERHLVSPEFISNTNGRALIINQDENISIMINEEDHIRIQVIVEGNNLDAALELADRIDTLINENLPLAFDSQLGYLTQCPTNLGTGMRASLMLHLPGLQESGAIPRIAATLKKLGIIIRGSYGEGSKVSGAMFQLSNQITLGLSEEEAIKNLLVISGQLISQERKVRKEMTNNIIIQDKISRAVGILKTAKTLSFAEFIQLVSLVRIGISTSLIENINFEDINTLTTMVQPAAIGKNKTEQEKNILRAQTTETFLKNRFT